MHYGGVLVATLTVKNLPDEIYVALTQTAKRNRRSINSEAIITVERGLDRRNPIQEQDLLHRVRKRREELARRGVVLTDDLLRKFKNEGRP